MAITTRETQAIRVARLPAVPETMRAAAIDRFGGPEVLTVHVLPVPTVDPREVLIAVSSAGVGSWDAEIQAEWWPSGKPTFPLVLGTDGAGKIAAVGSRVRRFKVGDAVYSYSFTNPKGGFYAEYVAVEADKVARKPDVLDMEHAGAIPTTGLTALQGIDGVLRIRRDESLIIHGASGGVGTLAVQFAKLRGARVMATASGPDGASLTRRLGADVAIDGKHDDVSATAKKFAPEGMDAVLGLIGGDAFERCIDTVRPGGRVAYPNGVEPEPKKRRGIDITSYDTEAGVKQFDHLNSAVEESKLKVPIAAKFPLDDAAGAHRRVSGGHVLGKIILRIK
jgi:NADPH2:quinone reductase